MENIVNNMTRKEIDIQRALGTLPLWKRIEMGEAEFEEFVCICEHPLIMIRYKNVSGISATYYKVDGEGDKRRNRAIARCIHRAKKANL